MADQSHSIPITDLLSPPDASLLSPAARTLLKGDVVAIGSGLTTARTQALTVQDVNSIRSAFANTSVAVQAQLWDIEISCCCCTPCCCAAAVMEPSRQVA